MNDQTTRDWFEGLRNRAQSGEMKAQIDYAWCLYRGKYGDVDIEGARRALMAARQHNSIIAEFNYAKFIHFRGEDGALRILKNCADVGYPPAQFYIAQFMYFDKKIRGKRRSLVYYRRASKNGNLFAHTIFSLRLAQMSYFPRNICLYFVYLGRMMKLMLRGGSDPKYIESNL